MGLSIFDEKSPNNFLLALDDASAVTSYDVAAGSPFPTRIDSILIASSDVVPHNLPFYALDAFGNNTMLGTIAVPAGSGFTVGVASVEAIATLFPSTNGIALGAGQILGVRLDVAVTATKKLTVTMLGGTI